MIGLLSVAIEHGRRWHAEAAATGRPELEAEALVHLARLYWEARDFQRQWQTVHAALALAEPLGESETLARAYALMAEAHMLSGQHAEAVRWADRALAMADAVGCPAVRAAALVNKGTALADMPDGHDQGVALLEQAIAEAEAGGFGYVLHRGLHNLLMQQVDTWPPERSRAVLAKMQATGERTGRGSEAPSWAISRSAIAVIEGDLEAAVAALRDARRPELAPVEGWVDPFWIDLHEAHLLLEAGDPAAVRTFLERHEDTVATRGDPCDAAWLWAGRLALAARRGNLEDLRGALADFRSVGAWTGWSWKDGAAGLHGLIAALRAGLPPDELRPFTDAVDRAERDRGMAADRWSPRRAGRQHLEAALLEAGGDPAAALDAYRRVLDHRDVYRAAYLVADCHQGAARCLLALGDEPAALDHARAAAGLLDRWPGWRRDEAAALLRRLGDGMPAATPAALTPREREVAALIAEGLSNGEIARRLYISVKTASVHVSNILAKLELSSRTEIATWFLRSGLEQGGP
jgi:DNA-binding CsgD family transcriptional regulator